MKYTYFVIEEERKADGRRRAWTWRVCANVDSVLNIARDSEGWTTLALTPCACRADALDFCEKVNAQHKRLNISYYDSIGAGGAKC